MKYEVREAARLFPSVRARNEKLRWYALRHDDRRLRPPPLDLPVAQRHDRLALAVFTDIEPKPNG
jgi:hypothetical protein